MQQAVDSIKRGVSIPEEYVSWIDSNIMVFEQFSNRADFLLYSVRYRFELLRTEPLDEVVSSFTVFNGDLDSNLFASYTSVQFRLPVGLFEELMEMLSVLSSQCEDPIKTMTANQLFRRFVVYSIHEYIEHFENTLPKPIWVSRPPTSASSDEVR